MKRPTLLALLAALLPLTTAPAAETKALWNGKDFTGWKLVTPAMADIATVCTIQADGVMAVAGKPIGYLTTTDTFQNYRLHAEWRWSATPANGGVMLHIASGPKDREWPLCFQMQLKHTRAGDILPMAGAAFAELPSPTATQVDRKADSSEKPAGEWNTCEIVCRGDTIECTVNGVLQNRITKCNPSAGAIGFQLEGAPFELRNIRLTPLE